LVLGCEHLFKEILFDALCYTDRSFVEWSYKAKTRAGKEKKLSLDGRILFSEVKDNDVKERVVKWADDYCTVIGATTPQNGVVFEVRQGYKSKDSKRQNGDIDNIAVAWSQGYLPVFAIFSAQIDETIVLRYKNSRGGIIIGSFAGTSHESLFVFCNEILGFDLAVFFERNSATIQTEMHITLGALLET
jgi:hypothetical protein